MKSLIRCGAASVGLMGCPEKKAETPPKPVEVKLVVQAPPPGG